MWETEWKNNLQKAAVANMKRRLDPKNYQVYDLQVNKQLPPEKEVNDAKKKVAEMIQAEVKRLEEKMV